MEAVRHLPPQDRLASETLQADLRRINPRYYLYCVGFDPKRQGYTWWLLRYEPGTLAQQRTENVLHHRMQRGRAWRSRPSYLQDRLASLGWFLDADYTFRGEPPHGYILKNIQARLAKLPAWIAEQERVLIALEHEKSPDEDRVFAKIRDRLQGNRQQIHAAMRQRVMVRQPGLPS